MIAKDLNCRDCGTDFVFHVDEQKSFADLGHSDPVRCQVCRFKKKQQNPDRATDKEFFEGVCNDCNSPTMLPFEPKPGKKVFCRSCMRRG